jgi:hypothetical protein
LCDDALVIWRLPHPVRGIVTFVVIFGVGSVLGGFGMGVPELAVLALIAGGVAYLVATHRSGGVHPSS